MAEASTRGAAEASVRESYPLHSVAGVRAKGSKSMRPQACLFPYLLGNLPQYQSLFQIVIRLTALSRSEQAEGWLQKISSELQERVAKKPN
jgi:hypothetical protein